MDRRMTLDVQRHALLAAGHQHGFAVDHARQFGRRLGDLGFGRDRTMHGGAEFLAVRRDQCRAAIDAVIVAFRIDHDRLAEPPRRVDDGADDARGQHALGVVGQHHGADLRQRRFGIGDDRSLALRAGRRGGLPIGAHQMRRVMLGDEAHLARGLPRLVDHQIGHDRAVELAERVGQRQARLVVADQTDENASRAERGDIARHIAGAADLDLAVPDREHRRRRLRRNARDFAIDEIVEHEIADAEHGLLRNKLEGFFEIEHALPAKAYCASFTGSDRRDRDKSSRSAAPRLRAA